MDNVITTNKLTKYYGKKCVVNNLDLKVPKGSVYGFLGRNGAGKSTTIKMLMGMIQHDSGSAEIFGEDISNLSPATRANIAYMDENHPLYNWMTVNDALKFTRPFYERWNQELFDQIIDHFELPRKQKLKKLSNGQRAQVSLALGVAPDPELLILDDPTLGLDTVVRRDFLESLIQIIHRQGRTILFSSHVLGDVERVSDRIGILVNGVLRVDCPTDHFKESVCKVVVEFDAAPPGIPDCHSLVNYRTVGRTLELVLVGYDDEQRAPVEALQPLDIEVVQLNLEDAFIEYTRGPKRSLPIFAGEERHEESPHHQGVA